MPRKTIIGDVAGIPHSLQEVSLTPREIDVARSLAEGNTTKQVATNLGISHQRVYQCIYNMEQKMGSSAYSLVYKAHQMGVL